MTEPTSAPAVHLPAEPPVGPLDGTPAAPSAVPPAVAPAVPLAMSPATPPPALWTLPPLAMRWLWGIVALACAFSLVSLVLSWRVDQRSASLERELVRRQQESAGQSNEARLLAQQAKEGMGDTLAKVALLEARLAEVTLQRGQLEDLIQSLSRSRDENLLVDVEAALRVALQQSAITGSAEPLVATLKQSDERLARYGQPRLEGVRRAIARDLDRVKAISVTDISTLSIKLDEAVRMVDELPLLAVAVDDAHLAHGRTSTAASKALAAGAGAHAAISASAAASAPASASTWANWTGRATAFGSGASVRVWDELKSLVRVTRIDHPDAILLAPEQTFFVRENLKLRLLNARLALLSRQFDTAQADLLTAQAALARYFDASSKRTALAVELIKQVTGQARHVSVPRPDDTLAALTAANAGR